jgi:hypothetical protein
MKNKLALASLAMDLRRVAMGYHRGSDQMAKCFFAEAMKRRNEIDVMSVKPYVRQLLIKLDSIRSSEEYAEDLLTYSVLFQNAATTAR